MLAALRDAVGAERWIGCGAHAIRVASRKRATLEALAAHGVPTPLDFAGVAARWVVKPDDGAGAVDAVHASARRPRRTCRRGSARRVRHTRALGGGRGALRVLARRRAGRRGGRVQPPGHPRGRRRRARVARRAPPRHRPGPRSARAGAARWRRRRNARCPGCAASWASTWVWHLARGPVAIEVNPRVTCAYVGLSGTLRRNLAADVLALHAAPELHHAGH